MFSAEEYKDIKKRDLDFAFEIEDIIHKSLDPDVRYKDSLAARATAAAEEVQSVPRVTIWRTPA